MCDVSNSAGVRTSSTVAGSAESSNSRRSVEVSVWTRAVVIASGYPLDLDIRVVLFIVRRSRTSCEPERDGSDAFQHRIRIRRMQSAGTHIAVKAFEFMAFRYRGCADDLHG